MDQQTIITPTEVLEIFQDGQRRGFAAGVLFCVVAKYLYENRAKNRFYGNLYRR